MRLTITFPALKKYPKVSEVVILGCSLDNHRGKLEQAIYEISTTHHESMSGGKPINGAVGFLAELKANEFNSCLIWILKKQLKVFDSSQWRRIEPRVRHSEAVSNSYLLLLELADQILDIYDPDQFDFNDAVAWWQQIMIEAKLESIEIATQSKTTKRKLKQELRAEHKLLKNRNNPYDPRTYPATFNLIEACLGLDGSPVNRSEDFNDFWTQYLGSYKEIIKSLEAKNNDGVEFLITEVKGDNLIAKTGGHSFLNLYQGQKTLSQRGKYKR